MEPKKLPSRKGPEFYIREAIIKMLESKGWYVKITHSSMYQSGLPDLYATHKQYGSRWIECKLPNMDGSRWTNAQKEVFPALSDNGTSIWILVAATETEYKKLFMPDNWFEYFLLKG